MGDCDFAGVNEQDYDEIIAALMARHAGAPGKPRGDLRTYYDTENECKERIYSWEE